MARGGQGLEPSLIVDWITGKRSCPYPDTPENDEKMNKAILYAIEEIPSGKVKIGIVGERKKKTIEESLKARLSELQIGNPRTLSVAWTREYPTETKAKAAEKAVQGALDRKGLSIQGEWHKPKALRLLDRILSKYESGETA